MKSISILILCILCYSYKEEVKSPQQIEKQVQSEAKKPKAYTPYSKTENEAIGFNSPKAINKLADIENEYFQHYQDSFSRYYGTTWRETAELNPSQLEYKNEFEEYTSSFDTLNIKPKAMHCTHYGMEALKAGLDSSYKKFDLEHTKIWKKREFAGWSVAYVLTQHFNWKAYLIISKDSEEYERCVKNYQNDKTYHVWKQPNIPLNGIFDFDKEKHEIDSLLSLNEFGWGFSEQGWHTWVTRFTTLKECNWAGAPGKRFAQSYSSPLFLKTKFTEYIDYASHVVVFPPKKSEI